MDDRSDCSEATYGLATLDELHQLSADRAATPWRQQAACNNRGADLFHPNKADSSNAAQAICATCTVTEDCLNYADVNRIREGIWGGLNSHQRRLRRAEHKARQTTIAQRLRPSLLNRIAQQPADIAATLREVLDNGDLEITESSDQNNHALRPRPLFYIQSVDVVQCHAF
jgi:WhiB family redox-sensing transcriptional regulator